MIDVLDKAMAKIKEQADKIIQLEKLLEHSVAADCREMRLQQIIENKDIKIADAQKSFDEMVDLYETQLDKYAQKVVELENQNKEVTK